MDTNQLRRSQVIAGGPAVILLAVAVLTGTEAGCSSPFSQSAKPRANNDPILPPASVSDSGDRTQLIGDAPAFPVVSVGLPNNPGEPVTVTSVLNPPNTAQPTGIPQPNLPGSSNLPATLVGVRELPATQPVTTAPAATNPSSTTKPTTQRSPGKSN